MGRCIPAHMEKIINFGRMKRTGLLILTALAFSLSAGAQTLESGKKLFNQGEYEKAKPIMLKYLNQKPADGSRNYWYGVCCFETGEQKEALPYLELASEKNIIKAYRALGDYYQWAGDYAMAISSYETFVDLTSKDKSQHNEATEARYTFVADSLKNLYRMLRNTTRVCFIDSMVISKDQLFSQYIIGESTGSIGPSSQFLGNGVAGEAFVPETRQNIIYSYAETDSSRYELFTRYRIGSSWDDKVRVQGLETDGNLRYPFIMNDGTTIYYASDGPASIGGLDIFVSRMNSATGRYLKPDNIGMPFNSSANDYMYVIDEANDLGWFATDRGMTSADSVCIYIFIPSISGQRYNYETEDPQVIAKAAVISSIAESQTNMDAVRSARQRLILLRYSQSNSKLNSFNYVIDDYATYHELTDFQNQEARDMYQQWTNMKSNLEARQTELEKKRMDYSQSSTAEKKNLQNSLLQFEDQVLELERKVINMEKEIRALELNYLNR